MSLVGVKYVGLKAAKQDNVAGTGLIWTQGQIHVVPASLVPKYQQHPDVWEIVPVGENDIPAVGLVVETLGTTQEEVDQNEAGQRAAEHAARETAERNADTQATIESIVTQQELPASFDPLSKSEIAAFAERNYGVKLDHTRMTKDALVQAVRNTHNGHVRL